MEISIDDLLVAWLNDLSHADRSPSTIKRYESVIRCFLSWYKTSEQRPFILSELTPIAFVEYREALKQTQATSTVNVHVCALRDWCAWLTSFGYLWENPAARLKLIGRDAPLAPRGLADTAVNALLRAAQRSRHPERNYALMQMLLQTGMRIGECQALTFEDITFGQKSGTVTIRAGKGNKARQVPLNGSARAALACYAAPLLGVDGSMKAVAAAWPRCRRGQPPFPLWRSQKGNPLSSVAIWRVVKGLVHECAARGLVPPDTTPHVLRHTFAHRYLDQHRGDLVGLARLLGHVDLSTTQIYVQPTAKELAKRVEQLPLNAYEEGTLGVTAKAGRRLREQTPLRGTS